MYTTDDFSELDKTNFKCYKFANGDLYYGEVAYMHPEKGIIKDQNELLDEEIKAAVKLVRHGNGAQLYGVNDQKTDCKYEGSWELDKKKGKGTAHFSDGSVYEGDFDNDLFDGIGKFIWKAGHVYIGKWKQGKMDGDGEFKHQDGHILKGLFQNNYMFDKEKKVFLNPFLTIDDQDVFLEENGVYEKLIEMNKVKFTENNIKIVYGIEEIFSLMETCIQNNMTPLLIRTIDRIIDKNEIFSYLPDKYVEIDLKYYYLKLREFPLDSPEMNDVYTEIKDKFIDAVTNGKFLILNYDDCQIQYDELFEPSLKEISGDFMFNPLMFTPSKFEENFSDYVQKKRKYKYNPKFRFIVYSRFLITDVNANTTTLKNVIEKKFKNFPLKSMNVFILSKPKKEVVNNEENQNIQIDSPKVEIPSPNNKKK